MQAVKLQYDEGFPLYAPRYEGEMGLLGSCGLMPNAFSCGMTTKNRIVIDANGDLYKCHRLSGKKEYSVGNIFDGINKNHPVYQHPGQEEDNSSPNPLRKEAFQENS